MNESYPHTDQINLVTYMLYNNITFHSKKMLADQSGRYEFGFQTSHERFQEKKSEYSSDEKFKRFISAHKLTKQIIHER